MMAACCSGHCVMHADYLPGNRLSRAFHLLAIVAVLALSSAGTATFAAEAPLPVPPEAEAAHQDLRGNSGSGPSDSEKQLDEAIFTEISALTVPEIGVALPADQED